MNVLDGVSGGELAYLIAAVVVSVAVGVLVVVAWARAEARSRVGERARVEAIRARLAAARRRGGVDVPGPEGAWSSEWLAGGDVAPDLAAELAPVRGAR